MRTKVRFVFVVILIALSSCSAPPLPPIATTEKTSAPTSVTRSESSSLVRVIDGDTIVVVVEGHEEKVRLVGINTPEKGFCGFEEARRALEEMLGTATVGLVDAGVDDRDKYGRLLRYLDIDGQDPGLELIRAGLAEADYDSRTGYDEHLREESYISLDALSASTCP
jgi:micrococcal nuclease